MPLFTLAMLNGGDCGFSTFTAKLCVALNDGEPLSATRSVIRFVEGDWARVGRQLKIPLFGFRLAPAGADTGE